MESQKPVTTLIPYPYRDQHGRELGIEIQLWSDEEALCARVTSTRGGKRYGAAQPTKRFGSKVELEDYISKRIEQGHKAAAKKAASKIEPEDTKKENKMAKAATATKKAAGKGAAAAAAAKAKAAAKKAPKKKEEPKPTGIEKPEVVEAPQAEEVTMERKALAALFLATQPEPFPNVAEFTEELVTVELKENIVLLQEGDKVTVEALEDGPAIWQHLCGMRKDLAGKKATGKDKEKGKGKKAEGSKKTNNLPARQKDAWGRIVGSMSAALDTMMAAGKGCKESDMIEALQTQFGRDEKKAKAKVKSHVAQLKKEGHTITETNGVLKLSSK